VTRRKSIPLASLLAMVVHAALAAAALGAPAITLTGRGYGHGVGMSQYGAQGLAQDGADAATILAHYYPGTELVPSEETGIRVLVGTGAQVALHAPAGTRVAGRAVTGALTAGRAGSTVALYGPKGAVLASGAAVELTAAGGPIKVGAGRYNGDIVLTPGASGVLAVEHTDLDAYIRGVVAREMPSTWEPAALEAQAIAARTYALATRKPTADFDVYADVRSQVYGGVSAQTAATDAAVDATAGLILTYEGAPIVTYFFSTSGGRTAAVEEVLGGDPRPYLVSVPDPSDAISPHHRWTPQRFTRAALGRAVGLGGPVRTIKQTLTPSGRVKTVRFNGPRGRSVTFGGPELRFKLGLRSSWFRFAIRKPARPAAKAAAATRGLRADVQAKVASLGAPAGTTPAPAAGRGLLEAGEPARQLSVAPPFVPDDPLLATRQWHLGAEGVSAFPLGVPGDLVAAAPLVRVAVIDGGIDVDAPDLAGLVPPDLRKSFVPGRPVRTSMHGTLVAGLIAARTGNGLGLSAPGVRVELMDLQVVSGDGSIQPRHEAAAIRWAAEHGARVINLSLGALRDPRPKGARGRFGDGFSPTEAAAVRYAVSRGVLVVAAVGNGLDGKAWTYADWPAALPHVLGVGAVDRARKPTSFSNRDESHVDLTAPGAGVVSTVPVAAAPSGLSTDAAGKGAGLVDDQGEVQGTSFAAPQVAGAAALLLALRPDLTGSQAARLLVHAARDVHRRGHDRATGQGELDVTAAVARLVAGTDVPPADDLEPNDDAGAQGRTLPRDVRVVAATADRWDDSLDVYRVGLKRGQILDVALRGPSAADFDLLVFRPGGASIAALDRKVTRRLVAGSSSSGATERTRFRAARTGVYDVVVWAARGSGAYELAVRR